MKCALLLSLIGCLLAGTASAAIDGAWTANADWKDGRIYFSLTRGARNQNGNMYRLSDFSGLTSAQVESATRADVQFELRRDPGTIAFEGSFKSGKGAGQFTFTPNRAFPAALRSMNLNFADVVEHGSEEETQYFLTSIGLTTDYIRTMQAEGYRGNLESYVEMRLHGVTKEYIDEMRALGFKDLSRDKVVELRIHGVTPDYVRKARAFWSDLTVDELMETRIHGATPEFAQEMAKAGYPNLSRERLVELRIHGVTPDYIRKARAFWNDLSLDELVETRIHGATPEFAQEIARAGYPNLSRAKLVEMRIHGVTAKFIRELAEAGYEKVPVDKLIEMRMHGIDAKLIKRMQKAQDHQ